MYEEWKCLCIFCQYIRRVSLSLWSRSWSFLVGIRRLKIVEWMLERRLVSMSAFLFEFAFIAPHRRGKSAILLFKKSTGSFDASARLWSIINPSPSLYSRGLHFDLCEDQIGRFMPRFWVTLEGFVQHFKNTRGVSGCCINRMADVLGHEFTFVNVWSKWPERKFWCNIQTFSFWIDQ